MKKAILITGASSGIGRHTANYLAERGHLVYATARKPVDLETLAKIKNVIPIELDVTNIGQLKAAVSFVTNQGSGLHGLVNNAGIGGLGGFSTWSETEMQQIFDVNVFAPWRISNAFMDHLLEAKGRIVNIGSQGGNITKKYFGPYSMTKYALEAYTEALTDELQAHGVHVSIVQPGGVVSRVGENALPEILERIKRAKTPFVEEAEYLKKALLAPPEPLPEEAPESETNRKASSPGIVSEAVYHALFSEKPKSRYLVGTQWEGDRVFNALFERVAQANDNPQHHYSREKLIALLDHHLDKTHS